MYALQSKFVLRESTTAQLIGGQLPMSRSLGRGSLTLCSHSWGLYMQTQLYGALVAQTSIPRAIPGEVCTRQGRTDLSLKHPIHLWAWTFGRITMVGSRGVSEGRERGYGLSWFVRSLCCHSTEATSGCLRFSSFVALLCSSKTTTSIFRASIKGHGTNIDR